MNDQKRAAPQISVIIPHLNQPDHLRRCLASLHDQTYGTCSIEIVVVDNGSPGLPTEICAVFPDIRLELEETPGPGPARNKGISVSTAEILAFIDADCIADPGWLRAIADAFQDDETAIIGGDVRIAVANPERLTALEAYESVFAYRQKEYIENYHFSGTGNLAMRRPAYKAVGPFAGISVAEDRDWGRRATLKGFDIRYVPEMIVFHPARTSFAELRAKWDRHVRHDFAEVPAGWRGSLMWMARAVALVISPAFETPGILATDRLSGGRARVDAATALTRIRFYRAKRMLTLLLNRQGAWNEQLWNR